MLRVQLGCERRFNIEFQSADSHFLSLYLRHVISRGALVGSRASTPPWSTVKVLFCPSVPDLRNNAAFWNVPRDPWFVFLVRVTCRRSEDVWSIDGLVTGVNRSTRTKSCHRATLPTTKLTWTDPGWISCLCSERPITKSHTHGTAISGKKFI